MLRDHTERCVGRACQSIGDNNLDTLVERGISERTAGLGWLEANKIIDAELEAGYADGTLTEATDEAARRWLDEGSVECRDECPVKGEPASVCV
jgi:hypothetical protein